MTPAELLVDLMRAGSSGPRLTAYDDASGERVELSARVLRNWVAKVAGLLQEEFDAEPGTTVSLDLPAHWRSLYWAFAVWSVGATVIIGADPTADVVVGTDPSALADVKGGAVLVTLPVFARSATGPVPAGVVDEALEVANQPDEFEPWAPPGDDDLALFRRGESTTYEDIVPAPSWPTSVRVHTTAADLGEFLATCLHAFAAGGSVVHSRGAGADLSSRLAEEHVTLEV